ncbi:DUF3048 domain-containing protein [Candidatus Saccharibacteria bacterium]|nr:DUF3048 domain-containing protein [Candidatus Saccharibacteria bacterium]
MKPEELAKLQAAFTNEPVEAGVQSTAPADEIVNEATKKPAPTVQDGKKSKSWIVILLIGILMLGGGVACVLLVLLTPEEILPDLTFPKIPSATAKNNVYSNLTGLEIANEADKTAPTYCVQTPNGLDGARPQAGLNQAGVVFEAIAESGITRLAAIYQAPTTAVIGPIRSLRIYYLEWDVPFDCTIVHAGGADDALAAVRVYKDLTENYAYMYRGTAGSRLWNNLFTTSTQLAQFSEDYGYTSSDVNGFIRMTPDESLKARVNSNVAEKLVITEPASANTSELAASVANIGIRFGGWASYNVDYRYDADTNSYNRYYESGEPHEIYECPEENLGEVNPENTCTLGQLSPVVVVAMVVEERKASDGYHEDITAIGSGDAYIFQNGGVVTGSWSKSSRDAQIRFYDASGAEVALAPGQTFVEAVPTYGSIEY